MVHNDYHRHAQAAAAQSTAWAVLCGLELIKARKAAGRGDWELWVESHCEFDIRTAQKYIALAENVGKTAKTNLGSPASPDFQLLTQAPSALSDLDRARLLALVTKIADGATITELYEEYGIVKRTPGTGSTGGYRVDEERVQVFLRGYHPTLEGTRYAELPENVQAEYRLWIANADTEQLQLALDYWQPIFTRFESNEARETVGSLPDSEKARLRASALRIVAWCDGKE